MQTVQFQTKKTIEELRRSPYHQQLGRNVCAAFIAHRRPEIFNSGQGAQFTSERFTGELERRGIAVSMDGRGRCLDNIFIERLWRSLKYEEAYWHDYRLVPEAGQGIGGWFRFYNQERPHQSLGYQTPVAIWRGQR